MLRDVTLSLRIILMFRREAQLTKYTFSRLQKQVITNLNANHQMVIGLT